MKIEMRLAGMDDAQMCAGFIDEAKKYQSEQGVRSGQRNIPTSILSLTVSMPEEVISLPGITGLSVISVLILQENRLMTILTGNGALRRLMR